MQIIRVNPDTGQEAVLDLVGDIGNLDYVKDGEIVKNAPTAPVMVPDQAALALLTGYEPGTVAFTAGFAAAWQLAADGTWATII